MKSRYVDKRGRARWRKANGEFRPATMRDFGIGGWCKVCGHLMLRHYGDERDEHPDPRKFGYRCFTCKPLNEDELKIEAEIKAARKKPPILEVLKGAAWVM